MRKIMMGWIVLLAASAGGYAQPRPPAHPHTFEFVSWGTPFDRAVVKGAPYSAEAVTETVQTLPDGNRIVRKSSATLYRDSEGRTRRDQALNNIGPWAASGSAPVTSQIYDPVAGVHYVLNKRDKKALKALVSAASPAHPHPPKGQESARPGRRGGASAEKTEQLGSQTIEGVQADGTRTTLSIPAGEVGNERPIEVISERWYSRDLQTVVMTRRIDPRVGETTYKLTHVNRSEPAKSVFEIPADYTVKDDHVRGRSRKPGDNRSN